MHASIEILVQLHHLGLDQFITRRSIQARHQKWKLPHHFFKSSTQCHPSNFVAFISFVDLSESHDSQTQDFLSDFVALLLENFINSLFIVFIKHYNRVVNCAERWLYKVVTDLAGLGLVQTLNHLKSIGCREFFRMLLDKLFNLLD